MILSGIVLAASSCRDQTPSDGKTGLNSGRLLMLEVSLPENKYADENQRIAFFQQALQRIAALPGVESTGAVSANPLSDDKQSVTFTIEAMSDDAIDSLPAGFNVVSPGYFETLMAHLIQGRTLTERDGRDGPRVVVINETLARRFFPDESPLGKRVQFDDLEEQDSWVEIVGVVGDIKQAVVDETELEFYMSYLQAPPPVMTIIVRAAAADARELADSVQREVKAVDGEVTISNIGTME
ncbi:MAG TPA: ABC transporter permease [Blastocatellia bacterium]|nr:ABC transporter permease [Blastocatellia bacterium]